MKQVLIDTKVVKNALAAVDKFCLKVQTGQAKSVETYHDLMLVGNDLRAATANAEPVGWQKIETAPEGTMILCANMKAMEARSWAYVAWIAGGKVCGHRMDMPTHWMPLPTPPKDEK